MNTSIERYVIRHTMGSKINQVEEFNFNKSELTIGRAANSDIQFDPEQDGTVSREHGKIVKTQSDPPIFTIIDNNSRNGIFVNKNRIKGSAPLNVGDEVQLGNNGPVFSFDIYPRPQEMMMATKVMEIPASIKATTISQVQDAQLLPTEPVKTGLGKQTVERMLVAERKKSFSKVLVLLVAFVIVLGSVGYAFRDKIFPEPIIPAPPPPPVQVKSDIKSPDIIAKENDDRVVQIERGWQLYDIATSDELWHEYTKVTDKDGQESYVALYIENSRGQIEPYIDKKKNLDRGVPIGVASGSGSGFVVSEDGFILTNRHIGAGWATKYIFPKSAFPGYLIRFEKGKQVVDKETEIGPQDVKGWVPSEARMVGGKPVEPGMVKGRNTYINVIFSGTSLRRPVQSVTPSDNHDVALLKVEIPESLSKVVMKDNYNDIVPGQAITVMGYPGMAPVQFVVRRSNDPMNPNNQFTTIPTPTVTPGSIGRIIPASSERDLTVSTFGDSYQLTNATGPGNSGGPVFDDKGNVIGLLYAGGTDNQGTTMSFAVPIKYGLELMGRKKMSSR